MRQGLYRFSVPVARIVPGRIVRRSTGLTGLVTIEWSYGHLGDFVRANWCPFVDGELFATWVGFFVYWSVRIRWYGSKYVPSFVNGIPYYLGLFRARTRVLSQQTSYEGRVTR